MTLAAKDSGSSPSLIAMWTLVADFQQRMNLTITTILIVATGIFLPYSPLTRLFGFVPLPAPFFVFLAISTVTYLALVELGERMLRLG